MNGKNVGIEEARKTLGDLVTAAQQGDDIVITRNGKPAARIVPIEESPMPTIAERIATYRKFSVVPTVVDTLGIDDRSPGLVDLGRAELATEAKPFADLVAAVDEFFGDELGAALAGPEAAEAEAEVRRIIAEHMASATTRLALTAAALSQVDLVAADAMLLHTVASTALKRAADQRFVEVVKVAARS